MKFYSCGSSHMIKENKSTIGNIRSAVVSWFCVRPTSKRWVLKIVQVTMKHDPLLMPCRIPCRLCIHLAFTYSVGPSSVMWSEIGPAPPFPTSESAWSVMVTGSQSRVGSGPECSCNHRLCTPTIQSKPVLGQWTGWVWEMTGWSSRLQENCPSILEEPMEYISKLIKKNTERSRHGTGWFWKY